MPRCYAAIPGWHLPTGMIWIIGKFGYLDFYRFVSANRIPEEFLEHAARVLRPLAHSRRMRLAEILLEGPRSVSELAALTGIPQPQTSGHLRLLLHCGLVQDERQGHQVFYRVSEPMVGTILECLRARALAGGRHGH